MYSSIYSVQSSTQRLPIRALFGFMLKLVESYLPSPLRISVWWFLLGVCLGSPHLWMSFDIFQMVRYTGHTFLLPLKTDSNVLSDDKITSTTTAPSGNFPCASTLASSPPSQSTVCTYLGLPPPVTHPHRSGPHPLHQHTHALAHMPSVKTGSSPILSFGGSGGQGTV